MSDRILQVLGERPEALQALATRLGVKKRDYAEFEQAVAELHRGGRLIIGEDRTVIPTEVPGKIVGTYRANPRGFGFIKPASPAEHGDLFVPPGRQMSAVTGDMVLAKVLKRGKRRGEMAYEGRVLSILQRARSQFVGRLQRSGKRWFVVPDGAALQFPIYIPDARARLSRDGTQVVVEITQYPEQDVEARGVIVEVLGRCGEPGTDLVSVIKQFRLPHEFPKACLQEARRQVQKFSPDSPERLDLRDRVVITIDPDDAKDFDDAISLAVEGDHWELGVHIADVASFVRPGSPLDEEARRRGNSVYFPGKVIPMLPEVLSNGVCSLQENTDRWTKSVFLRYDSGGQVVGERFASTVIRSARRLTYREATRIVAGRRGGVPGDVVELLQQLSQLARAIQARRFAEGMIALDLPGVELVLDDDGRLVDVRPEDTGFSHTIIEMFMIEANEAIARLLARRKVPFLRRIHPQPEQQAFDDVAAYLRTLGLLQDGSVQRQQLQEALNEAKGKPESYSVNLAVLRAMQQAEYSPSASGHFALASEHYCHFTSPIRRYPDLTIHRLLHLHLHGGFRGSSARDSLPDRAHLAELGAHCSFTERRAEEAERELKEVMILRLLSDHVGENFRGLVSGVAEFGLFIQLDKYLIDGLVRTAELPDDDWEVVPEAGCMRGRRRGRRFTVGDSVQVTVIAIDVPNRRLDLSLHRQLTRATAARGKASKRGGRRKTASRDSKAAPRKRKTRRRRR